MTRRRGKAARVAGEEDAPSAGTCTVGEVHPCYRPGRSSTPPRLRGTGRDAARAEGVSERANGKNGGCTRHGRLGSSRGEGSRTNHAAYRRRKWPRTWSCEGPRPPWRDARRVPARVPRGSGSCRLPGARLARGQSRNRPVARTTRARTPRVGTRERSRELLGERRVSREEPSSAFGRDEIPCARGNGGRVRGFGALLRGTALLT